MFLKRIQLSGFKSFANKTVLDFFDVSGDEKHADQGKPFPITAIVGPNGSGKSNIADAIRWMMGEQSMKSLRGKKSQDIIFSGSGEKKPMAAASVSVTFDNSDKKLPLEFSEVVAVRKIYRSGEGECLINGAPVRLLDIVDLFAAVGVGKGSQSVLNQGMSDAILNASATERRAILEEAAGVKPYQLKRDRSVRKLLRATENLERTKELIGEIEPRLRILARQAKRAEQRAEVERELRTLQSVYYSSRWTVLQAEKRSAQEECEDLGREVIILTRKGEVLSEQRAQKSAAMQETTKKSEKERDILSIQERLSRLERERALAEGRMEAEEEREKQRKLFEIIPVDLRFVQTHLEEIAARHTAIIQEMEAADTVEKIRALTKKLSAVAKDLLLLHDNCGKKTVEVKRNDTAVQRERQESQRILSEWRERVSVITDTIVREEENLATLRVAVGALSAESEQASREFFACEQEIFSLTREADAAKERQSDAKIRLARTVAHEEDIVREVSSEMGMHPEKISVASAQPHAEEGEMLAAISRVKNRLAQIGGIDPSIGQEYHETKERFEFLSAESQDLEKAITSFREIIEELDGRIRKEFSAAFSGINKEFGKFFSLMFEGGAAELKKVSAETAEEGNEDEGGGEGVSAHSESREVGIEIFVHPPKKTIQSLSVLSGGERSLVSLALLFAIIAYNPPPFVVLDEVEAALDEHNSQRFADMLNNLSPRTQFIVITHNRETMKYATTLYGATMGRDGATKLLSVKMSSDK